MPVLEREGKPTLPEIEPQEAADLLEGKVNSLLRQTRLLRRKIETTLIDKIPQGTGEGSETREVVAVGGSFKRLTGNSLKSSILLLAERLGADLNVEPSVRSYEVTKSFGYGHVRWAVQERSFDTGTPGASLVFQTWFDPSTGDFRKEDL